MPTKTKTTIKNINSKKMIYPAFLYYATAFGAIFLWLMSKSNDGLFSFVLASLSILLFASFIFLMLIKKGLLKFKYKKVKEETISE
jgi:apolipoprotein N-acyltransferase